MLLDLKDIEKKIKDRIWSFIVAECKRHKVEIPLYGFERIEAEFQPRGLCRYHPPKIIANYLTYEEFMGPIFDLGEKETELEMIETLFHELKHYIDSVNSYLLESYRDDVLKWEGRATKYATKMMIKYKFRPR